VNAFTVIVTVTGVVVLLTLVGVIRGRTRRRDKLVTWLLNDDDQESEE
jgi:hypothetical protein